MSDDWDLTQKCITYMSDRKEYLNKNKIHRFYNWVQLLKWVDFEKNSIRFNIQGSSSSSNSLHQINRLIDSVVSIKLITFTKYIWLYNYLIYKKKNTTTLQ